MNEKKNLAKAIESYQKIVEMLAENNIRTFHIETETCFGNISILLKEMAEEALQTAAGRRWFNGQLKIHPTVELLYAKKAAVNGTSFLQEKKAPHIITIIKKTLDEVQQMIDSGKDRYIQG